MRGSCTWQCEENLQVRGLKKKMDGLLSGVHVLDNVNRRVYKLVVLKRWVVF